MTVSAEGQSNGVSDLSATAIHEAGHAVIGRVMAQACGGVTIEPDLSEWTAGYAVTADPWATMHAWDSAGRWRDFSSIVRGRIITYMAGRYAEEAFFGECAGGDEDDRHQIDSMLAEVTEDPALLRGRLEKFSRAAVHRHRVAIRILASELEHRRRMAEDEVAELLQSHLPRWRWPPQPVAAWQA